MKMRQTFIGLVLALFSCASCTWIQVDVKNGQIKESFSDYRAGIESLKAKQYAAAEEKLTSAINNMQSVVDFYNTNASVRARNTNAFNDARDRIKFNGHSARGEARYFQHKFDLALEDFATAIKKAGECNNTRIASECEEALARSHYYAGMARMIGRKEHAEAEKHFTNIIDRNKLLQGEARMQRSIARIYLDKSAEALDDITWVTQKYPQSAEALGIQCLAHVSAFITTQKRGHLEKALDIYKKSAAIKPNDYADQCMVALEQIIRH